MKAILVDDERPARSEMKRLLKAHAEIEIIGEASSTKEALLLIAKSPPDILFLDIQMGDETGFDLLARLKAPIPKIIFTTAFDEYAVRAFEVNALDYLLKPVESIRLAEALKRAVDSPPSEQDPEPVTTSRFEDDDRVLVRTDDRCWFVPIREISLLESEGNYTRIHLLAAKPLIYRSLNALEERLPKDLFFRANRSQLINLSLIEGIENWFSGNLKARVRGGIEVEISRRQSQAFRERATL